MYERPRVLCSRPIKYLADPRNTGFKFGRRPVEVPTVCGRSNHVSLSLSSCAKTDKENIYPTRVSAIPIPPPFASPPFVPFKPHGC